MPLIPLVLVTLPAADAVSAQSRPGIAGVRMIAPAAAHRHAAANAFAAQSGTNAPADGPPIAAFTPYPSLPPPPPPPPPAPENFFAQYGFNRSADGTVSGCTVKSWSRAGANAGKKDCDGSHVGPFLRQMTDPHRPGEAMSFRIRWDMLPWADVGTLATGPDAVAQFVSAGQSDLSGSEPCVYRLAGETRLLKSLADGSRCTAWTSGTVITPVPETYLSFAIFAAPPGASIGSAEALISKSIAYGSVTRREDPASADDRSADLLPDDLPDRFVVTNTAVRHADGSLSDCTFVGMPSEDACTVFTDGDEGPARFARTYRPGETLRLTFAVDVRPWTGALQMVAVPGQVEQVVLLGGEDDEGCARLGEGGPAMRSWSEVTACPLTDDPPGFFAALGDPRPRQSTWTLAAELLGADE